MQTRFLAAALAAALAGGAGAQERPSEEELFGGPAKPAPAQEKPAPAQEKKPGQPGTPGSREETEAELFGSKSPANAPPPPPVPFIPKEREDWLKIGGQLQLRAQASAFEDTAPHDWPFSSPNLLDTYLDTRPNDRVRGFVLGRLSFDPTLPSDGARPVAPGTGGEGETSISGFGASPTTSNPGAVLDQMWMNFDVQHRVFVTAGRQHVKWGVGRYWNPTDYLHPVKRDPLATFDARVGTTMVKLHVPWEKRGWNLYGIAMLEDLAGDTTQTASKLGRVGGGGRAEVVVGGAELGLDAMFQDGHRPRYGVDLSAGIWDLDVYSEAALRYGGDGPRWVRGGTPMPGPIPPELQGWVPEDRRRLTPQVVAGATWSVKYSDEDSLTVGGEYFYNDLGYDDPSVYPFLLLGAPAFAPNGSVVQQEPNAFQSFYVGKHYAAVNLALPRPGRWNDTTIILTALGNLSDRSYLARLDVSVLALTYMTVETFVAYHFGKEGGEFKLTIPADVASLVATQGGGFGLFQRQRHEIRPLQAVSIPIISSPLRRDPVI